jgi:hypothetical protein
MFASLIELPAGAYVVVGKAIVRSNNPHVGQVDFRLRAHPTNPHRSPLPTDEDFSQTTLRSSPAESTVAIETIALTFATDSSEMLDIDFLYEGVDPVEVEAVKITAIAVDQVNIQGA